MRPHFLGARKREGTLIFSLRPLRLCSPLRNQIPGADSINLRNPGEAAPFSLFSSELRIFVTRWRALGGPLGRSG